MLFKSGASELSSDIDPPPHLVFKQNAPNMQGMEDALIKSAVKNRCNIDLQ